MDDVKQTIIEQGQRNVLYIEHDKRDGVTRILQHRAGKVELVSIKKEYLPKLIEVLTEILNN